ncbi:MAG: murein transglycosylase B, partial [Sphingobacteriia bacterium]|nr:murein transglycosylase B [Sphingobacteriia bacterium]
MLFFRLMVILFGLTTLLGCGSTTSRSGDAAGVSSSRLVPASGSTRVDGDFAGYAATSEFIQRMQRHGFSPSEVATVLSGAKREQWIIDAMNRQAPRPSTGPTGAWVRYRAKFLTEDNIANGVRFWQRNEAALERASARYGVPPEYIVAIIGVETRYGGYIGKTRIIDALATLAFAYPRRAEYFTSELESFLIMARDEGVDPFGPRGSYAGAMGLGQFMPTSFRDYAVDFDGDGDRDLWSPVDAIGSVANYFRSHGWRAGEPVAVRARVEPGADPGSMKTGFDTRYGVRELAGRGITSTGTPRGPSQASLLRLDVGTSYEYWLGFNNFYTITRYNH